MSDTPAPSSRHLVSERSPVALAISFRGGEQRLVVFLNLRIGGENRRRDRRYRVDVAFGFIGRHGDDLAAVLLPDFILKLAPHTTTRLRKRCCASQQI